MTTATTSDPLSQLYGEAFATGDDHLIAELDREQRRRHVRRELDRIEQAGQIKLPPPQESYSWTVQQGLPAPPIDWLVSGLVERDANVSLTAQFKTGKSTLLRDLTRCLTDTDPFLGRFSTKPLTGTVGYWNLEMPKEMFERGFHTLGIRNSDALRIWNLRGARLPLLTDVGAEAAVEWLRSNDVQVWIIDTWGRLCKQSGVGENDNDEIGALCGRIDEIKSEAGVSVSIAASHTGRALHEVGAEHARGATAYDDWVDARLLLTRKNGDRFIWGEGRDVNLDEAQLVLDDATQRVTLRDGGRREAAGRKSLDEVVAIVSETPGLSTSEVMDKMVTTSQRGARSKAIQLAKDECRIDGRKDGKAVRLFPIPDLLKTA